MVHSRRRPQPHCTSKRWHIHCNLRSSVSFWDAVTHEQIGSAALVLSTARLGVRARARVGDSKEQHHNVGNRACCDVVPRRQHRVPGRGDEQRVEEDGLRVLKVSTESAGGMGDDNDKRVPGKPHKSLDRTEELPTCRQSARPRWQIDRVAMARMCRCGDQWAGHRDVPRCPGHGREVEGVLRWGDRRGETECVGAWMIIDGG